MHINSDKVPGEKLIHSYSDALEKCIHNLGGLILCLSKQTQLANGQDVIVVQAFLCYSWSAY